MPARAGGSGVTTPPDRPVGEPLAAFVQRHVRQRSGVERDVRQLAAWGRSLYRTGLPHLVVSVVFVQGLTYLAQLLIARLVLPADFGIVRSVEAALAVILMLVSAGMPSLAVKSIAEVQAPAVRARLLGRLLVLSMGVPLLCVPLVAAVAPWFVPPEARAYLVGLLGVPILASFNRTGLNYFQGIKQIQRMAVLNAALSLCALAVIVLAVALVGLPGWAAGRYLGEACFGLALLIALCPHIRLRGSLPSAYAPAALLGLGVPIALTLVLRSVQDNLGLLLLGVLGFDSEALGYYGVSTLIVTAGLLLPGAVANIALPHLASRTRLPDQLWPLYARLLRGSVAVSLASAVTVGAVALVLPLIVGPEYAPAVPLLALLATAIPFRGVATAAAVLLLACDRALLILMINVSVLALAVALSVTLAPAYGLYGVALGTLLAEILTMLAFVLAARALRCHAPRPSKVAPP